MMSLDWSLNLMVMEWKMEIERRETIRRYNPPYNPGKPDGPLPPIVPYLPDSSPGPCGPRNPAIRPIDPIELPRGPRPSYPGPFKFPSKPLQNPCQYSITERRYEKNATTRI